MPKKRFSTQFSKPQSTVHPSLSSAVTAAGSSNSQHDAPLTVNELLSSSRKIQTSSIGSSVSSPTPTLPPQIRHLLSQPETPTPSPRIRPRRRLDENGRPLPAGPPPPRSWLERSRHTPQSARRRGDERVYPTNVYHLPGLKETGGKKLQEMCMRQMARCWEYVSEYEQNNLAQLPTRVRVELVSYVAVHGPDEGIGFEGLRNLCLLPEYTTPKGAGFDALREGMDSLNVSKPLSESTGKQAILESTLEDWDEVSSSSSFTPSEHNNEFFRLDISGSLGHSISFKQLNTLLERPSPSLSAPIPHLTHLSLSHPSCSAPWRGLLALSKHIPTLTHLSLAYWPTPTLTPNSRAAVMSSQFGKDIQYGGTGFYSHTLDNDFREAGEILRRLAGNLYKLEYLDLSGCTEWIKTLRWNSYVDATELGTPQSPPPRSGEEFAASQRLEGINWRTQLLRLTTLKLHSGITLTEDSTDPAVCDFVEGIEEARAVERSMARWSRKGGRKGAWVEVGYEDWNMYRDFWQGASAEEKTKRQSLHRINQLSNQ